jgi:hypothetical protein
MHGFGERPDVRGGAGSLPGYSNVTTGGNAPAVGGLAGRAPDLSVEVAVIVAAGTAGAADGRARGRGG